MDEYTRQYGSFADRHPILAGLAIIGFIIFAGAPLIPMHSERIACEMGLNDLWCPPDSEHRQPHSD